MFFSVIIPAYNVENYVEECIISVLSQSYKDFEIVIVDDDSSDGTREIIQGYAKENDCIVYKSIMNVPVGDVRNVAMSMASGEYFVFVDADDRIGPEMLKKIHECIESYDSDICFLPNFYVDNNGDKKACSNIPGLQKEHYSFKDRESFVNFATERGGMIPASMWNCVCSKELVQKNRIKMNPEYSWSEDSDFIFNSFSKASRISICCHRGYEWNTSNAKSTSHTIDAKKIVSRMDVYKKWFYLVDHHCFGYLSDETSKIIKDWILRNYCSVLEPYTYLWDYIQRKTVRNRLKEDDLLSQGGAFIPREYRDWGLILGRYLYMVKQKLGD